MVKFALLLLVVIVVRDSFQENLTIVNGTTIDIKDRPYQVAINVRYIKFFYAECHSGGTIISVKYVLSAAHSFVKDYTYVIRCGSSECTWWGDVYDIKRIINHPQYKHPIRNYDLAILEVDTPIKFSPVVQPIVMADTDFDPSYFYVDISGYGRICYEKGCPDSVQLTKIELATLSLEECRKYDSAVEDHMICHRDNQNRSKTTCLGDSGGPVTLVGSGEKTLVGIVSFGYDCNPNNVTISSSIPKFRVWIKSITNV